MLNFFRFFIDFINIHRPVKLRENCVRKIGTAKVETELFIKRVSNSYSILHFNDTKFLPLQVNFFFHAQSDIYKLTSII